METAMKYKLVQVLAVAVVLNGCATMPPLHKAALRGDSEEVTRLVESGLTVDTEDNRGDTALMYAASANEPAILKYLLSKGANIGGTRRSYKAIHAAAANGNKHIVELLVENGADVNESSGYLGTPLHVAAYGFVGTPPPRAELDYPGTVLLLITLGADINQRAHSVFSATPLQVARDRNADEVVRVLQEHGGK